MAERSVDGVIYMQISIGEFLDKLTILRIKSQRIGDSLKLHNIHHELSVLERTWNEYRKPGLILEKDIQQLQSINEKLWDIEDQIREKEAQQQFDNEFIELARSVYRTNDERARIKKQINLKSGSQLLEEKSYSDY